MRTLILLAMATALNGCAAGQQAADTVTTLVRPHRSAEEIAAAADARREREMTRRYAFCVKQQLGAFGSFASPESRRKASESCQGVMQQAATTP